jgi:hypothetical protein
VATNECSYRPASHRHAVIGSPAGPRRHPFIGDCFASLEIDNCQIGVVASGDAALGGDAEQTRRARAGEINKTQERQSSGVDVIKHDRNERLHPGHA